MHNGSLRGPREDALPNAILEDYGRTSLHEAAAAGDEKSLQVLLAGGVDRNTKDLKFGNTPLHEAAWRGFSRCVKLLCVPPHPKSTKESTKESKIKGVIHGTRGAVHSALLGTRNAGGFSALHLAAQNGHNQSCREILLAGGDPDVQNNYGDTPLHTACRYGHAGATRILISAKCDPNRINLNGDTPLHIACAMGRRKLTRILLEAGGSLDIQNAQNETPRDIALRKNLPEIIEILDNPIKATPTNQRERDKSTNSKSTDKVDGSKATDSKQKTTNAANPATWSPYGCHYFPDPRSFPSPKLDTLPKEPLSKGEQYYLDLAGNIRKGPIGVGNTCYCGPFFRHIEERITRNRKSLRKYVHKATERIDNKVQALAIRTDDQIEQLTRSMLTDRIRCEGRRLHLEEWLKRGDQNRMTVSNHAKSKKNLDNANTLTRCKSLEILDDDNILDKKMQNSRSFDLLDETEVIVHRDPEISEPSEQKDVSSLLSTDRKTSRTSDRSKSSGGNQSGENYSVSKRLQQLLTKTNEILEMEKTVRSRNKDAFAMLSSEKIKRRSRKNNEKDKISAHIRHSMYADDIIDQLKQTTLSDDKYTQRPIDDAGFIAAEMRKITTSLLGKNSFDHGKPDELPPMSPEIAKDFTSIKETERRSDQEQEHSSVRSGSSHKNPSSLGSGYVPEFSNLRVTRSRPNSTETSNKSVNSIEYGRSVAMSPHGVDYESSQDIDAERKFKTLISALRKDYSATKQSIETEYAKESATNEQITQSPQQQVLTHEIHDETSLYEVDEGDPSTLPVIVNGFYHNSCFDDAPSSSSNTLKSERRQPHSETGYPETEDTVELTEMANVKEINDLKSRILNGSNWRSQVLRKSQQQLESSEDISTNGADGVNNIVQQKFEIKNSEIKTLKSPTSGVLRRSKVQELVAKIQYDPSNQSGYEVENNDGENSESSEDEHENDDEPDANAQMYPSNSLQNTNQMPDDEMNFYHGRAQPQVANLYQNQTNTNMGQYQTPQIIDTRSLIPKDAYFHELPNKNRMRPIVDKLPEKQMFNFNDQFHNSNQMAARNRNPLPYVQGYDILPVPNTTFVNRPYPDPNQPIQFVHTGHPVVIQHGQNPIRYTPHPEKLLSNRKFSFSNGIDNELSRIHINQQQQIAAKLQHGISITPEQAQLERDLNNDSGYSTKICGSSHGPSPSLSGHTDYGGMGSTSSNEMQPSHVDANGVTYFIGNVGASSLV